MAETIRWGILGTGAIARTFAEALAVLPDAAIVAVGSRKQDTADKFGERFGIPKRYPTYDAVVNDPDVDVVYVSTPHHLHKDNTLMALEAGKPVLCEKPFAVNAAEAEIMIKTAREKKLFLMEAMWTRYIPALIQARKLLNEGAIGDIRMFQADFCFIADFLPKGRLFNRDLAGGALLDVGIYPVSLAAMLLGIPDDITGFAHLGETGVDEQFGVIFHYKGGELALLSGALRTDSPCEATIAGTKGHMRIHRRFWHSEKLTLSFPDKVDKVLDIPYQGNGLNYEAAEVMKCLRGGKLESEAMSLDESLAIMKVLDIIRGQWGLKYPTE